MKPGESYEKTAQLVFREVFKSLPNLEVQQNVRVKGLTASHQIDVLVTFQGGPILYRTVIQAKDWSKPVDQGEVLKLHGVLVDLPGQPKGILVSRAGFQAGAKQLAKQRGIGLYELRPPVKGESPTDELVWDVKAFIRRLQNFEVEFDQNWMKEEAAKQGVPKGTKVRALGLLPREIPLIDEVGKPWGTLADAIKQMFPQQPGPVERAKRTLTFNPPLLIPTETGACLPHLRCLGISAEIWTEEVAFETTLSLEYTVVWVLRDIDDGQPLAFDAHGQPVNPEPEPARASIQWILDPGLDAT